MSTAYALIATVSFHGTVVEQRHVRRGRPVVIGRDEALAVPLPAGVPFLARCVWKGPDRVEVTDGRGREHALGPDEAVHLALGPVELELELAPQFPLKRSMRVDTLLSAVWLAVILMSTLGTEFVLLGRENRCTWGIAAVDFLASKGIDAEGLVWDCPGRHPSGADRDVALTAEYLARLLRQDYEGDEEGYKATEADRPDPQKRAERIYLPAGDEGPITAMGGAEEVSPDPVRTPAQEPSIPTKGERALSKELAADEVGTEVELPEVATDPGEDGIVEVEEAEEGASDPPSEEERGWGIRDWYDEQDERLENLEIELMLQEARRQLAIDPDSAWALQTLSYYQYLAQDYEGAIDTYDRFISLYPDDPSGYNNKALVYKRLGEYDIEELLYRVALSLEPGDETALNNLAVNLSHQGRIDEALAIMKQLETIDPDDPYADLHRAKIYAQLGDQAMALQYLDRALAGMARLDTLHHIEFRQDIRVDPSFARLRETRAFRDLLVRYYGADSPLQEG